MQILVLNSGSSSIKYELFHTESWLAAAAGMVENIDRKNGRMVHKEYHGAEIWQTEKSLPDIDHRQGFAAIQQVLHKNGELNLAAIGHRVVHGGEFFSAPVRIDGKVLRAIRELIPLAPLHNPANLLGIEAAMECCPTVPQVAVFDTAFHQSMPDYASRYALPARLYEKHRVRRYGFHGTSHSYVSKAAAEFLDIPYKQFNCIVLHLGNGASACAVRNGKSVDTSMGMTPLEGLVMGTRCGDIDPAIIFYLRNNTSMDTRQIETMLNRESGLKGLSGHNDMREILTAREQGDKPAALAFDIYCYRVKKYIGAYCAALSRVDAVIFTGGIGENAIPVRERVCRGLEPFGIQMDFEKNARTTDGIIQLHRDGAKVKILMVPTDEEREIAMQAMAVLG